MLLTGVYGDDGVSGDAGEVLDVTQPLADVWADGQRAERWKGTQGQMAFREGLGLAAKPEPAAD
jgi:hypothetical protein